MSRSRRSIGRAIAACAVLLLAAPPAARAQNEPGPGTLSGLLPDLILREVRLPPPTLAGVISHEAHFTPLGIDDFQNPAVGVVQGFNHQVMGQLSTFPLGSSTGGFTYTFDPELGTFRRTSVSFGPAFAERALTIGRGRLSTGLNYQRSSYTTFEGQRLDDGAIKFYLRHEDCCSVGGPPGPPTFGVTPEPDDSVLTPFFEGDLVEAALHMRATSDTVAVFLNYGVADRWDVGLAVPIVRVQLDASVTATILRISTENNPNIHTFESGNPGATQRVFTRAGSATGLGDIVLRTKYRLVDRGPAAFAVAADIRLPTGDEQELLGAGTQAKVYLIASSGAGRFGQHVNVGYTFSAGDLPALGDVTAVGQNGGVPDEINYAGGIEVAVEPRVTLMADLVGRTLRNAGRLTPVLKTLQYQEQVPTTPPPTFEFEEFAPRAGSLTQVLGAAGVKVNPVGNFLVSASVLFPLTKAGLRSRITTVVGLDYAF